MMPLIEPSPQLNIDPFATWPQGPSAATNPKASLAAPYSRAAVDLARICLNGDIAGLQ